ncbi:MAG: MotA/TolQ/ExbB proton channel family protein [Gammaproteobacteria bacterium]|nr:MotA/TolQ/ExbB proton channel family protein [Gammaproteobacteria bacterium]
MSTVRHIANNLVLIGLIGTVLGFIIALSPVAPEAAADVNAVTPMVSTLIAGFMFGFPRSAGRVILSSPRPYPYLHAVHKTCQHGHGCDPRPSTDPKGLNNQRDAAQMAVPQ